MKANSFRFSLKSLLALTVLSAIVVALVWRTPRSLAEVRGVQILSQDAEGEYTFLFTSDITRTSTDQILRLLPQGGQLWFYDSNKTISDPGLYVSLRRISDDEFVVRYGNHGWSSDWFALNYQQASDYFWICHHDNLVHQRGWPHTEMQFEIGLDQPDRINRDPRYEFLDYVLRLIEAGKGSEEPVSLPPAEYNEGDD